MFLLIPNGRLSGIQQMFQVNDVNKGIEEADGDFDLQNP